MPASSHWVNRLRVLTIFALTANVVVSSFNVYELLRRDERTPADDPIFRAAVAINLVGTGAVMGAIGLAFRTVRKELLRRRVESDALDVERKRIEEIGRVNAERFRSLTELIPQLVWNSDANGRVTYFNSGWTTFTGLTIDTIPTQGWWKRVVHPDDVTGLEEIWRHALAENRAPITREIRVRRAADAQYRWFLTNIVPLYRSDGAIDQWIGSLSDIDDQKRESERLEVMVSSRTQALTLNTAELARSNQELEKFAYVASHDLQEPLRKIQAFGDRLRQKYRDVLDEAGRDYLDRMNASATRMRALINDLLAFSRVTSEGKSFAPVDLNEIVDVVVSDLETRLEECGGRVVVESLPTVRGDQTQVRQLFQNLLANALKFRKPDVPPVVRVTAVATSHLSPNSDGPSPGWRIVVSDNGIGFDNAYSERIFEVFQRLHGRGEYEGTGIGLAICRKIVERHGGTISADGRLSEGSEFRIDLPASGVTGP